MSNWWQSMIGTLDFCLLRLPSTIHPSHIERIKVIKNWLGGNISGTALEHTDSVEQIINWIEQETAATAETAHGLAMIDEIPTARSPYLTGRAATRYRARILHSTGAVLAGQELFSTFEGADTWIRTIVTQLDNPQLEKANLESILFTLAICKQVLPDDTDPGHVANLQLLEEILVGALL